MIVAHLLFPWVRNLPSSVVVAHPSTLLASLLVERNQPDPRTHVRRQQ
jgi:hypothetical protein